MIMSQEMKLTVDVFPNKSRSEREGFEPAREPLAQRGIGRAE